MAGSLSPSGSRLRVTPCKTPSLTALQWSLPFYSFFYCLSRLEAHATLYVCSVSNLPFLSVSSRRAGVCVFLGPVVSRAPSRVPGTEQVLHTYCWMEVSDPSRVNTDSKMHSYGCPPTSCTDMLPLPVHTRTDRPVVKHAHMLKHTHTDTHTQINI